MNSILNLDHHETLDKVDSYTEYVTSIEKIVDTQFWKKCLSQNTKDAYISYLSRYPSGLYINDAQNKIDEIVKEKELEADKKAWEKAKNINTKNSYKTYLTNYSNGTYANEAKIKVNEFVRLEKDKLLEEQKLRKIRREEEQKLRKIRREKVQSIKEDNENSEIRSTILAVARIIVGIVLFFLLIMTSKGASFNFSIFLISIMVISLTDYIIFRILAALDGNVYSNKSYECIGILGFPGLIILNWIFDARHDDFSIFVAWGTVLIALPLIYFFTKFFQSNT